MTTLHTFGCSITQGFALPDVVRTITDDSGRALTKQELSLRPGSWTDIHVYEPSMYAWPQQLANLLDVPVHNSARRGACFNQISRQCAVATGIKPNDVVVIMWTYLSRLSLQWPARTSVPLCNIVDASTWRTRILPGFNRFHGLSPSDRTTREQDDLIERYIHKYTNTYMDPMSLYDRYYNSLVQQTMTDGFLRATGARVIHLSVESEPVLDQLEEVRQQLDPSLATPYIIPDPSSWYSLAVDYASSRVIHDPSIPPAANDMHPSVAHHELFANHIYQQYFN